jgi:choline kinase
VYEAGWWRAERLRGEGVGPPPVRLTDAAVFPVLVLMLAVVLAAGRGARLGGRTSRLPKPLVEVGGRPLIEHALRALAEAGGIDEVVVVTGYLGRLLEEALAGHVPDGLALHTIRNPSYDLGAASSLATARPLCGDEPFLLLVSDHLLPASLLARLLAAGRSAADRTSLVAADFAHHEPRYEQEATKLLVGPGGRVSAIGKGLPSWNALDAGAFFCSAATWGALDAVPADGELSAVFGEVARRGQLGAVDVTGCPWYDVDTAADLRAAERQLASKCAVGGRAIQPAAPLALEAAGEPGA